MDDKDYATAMAYLEAGVHQQGIASVSFNDGQTVMISLEMLRGLVADAEAKGQDRVLIFIARGKIVEEGAQA